MVAMPEELREDYVRHTRSLLSDQAFALLISLRYDGDNQGPPFSVSDEQIISMWSDKIQKISSEDLVQTNPQYRDVGYGFFEESVWHIVPA